MYHFTASFLKLEVRFADEKSLLYVECCFHHGNHGFNVTYTSCIIYHATKIDEIFQILRLFNTLSSLKSTSTGAEAYSGRVMRLRI